MHAHPTYVLKWKHGTDPRYSWFIRGIKPDGSFYGDMTAFVGSFGGKQISFAGTLIESDHVRLQSLIDAIRAIPSEVDSDMPWTGLLAEDTIGKPTILFRYVPGSDQPSGVGELFLELVTIIRPYLNPYYQSLEDG